MEKIGDHTRYCPAETPYHCGDPRCAFQYSLCGTGHFLDDGDMTVVVDKALVLVARFITFNLTTEDAVALSPAQTLRTNRLLWHWNTFVVIYLYKR